jgi:class 3 adenylate cyclase
MAGLAVTGSASGQVESPDTLRAQLTDAADDPRKVELLIRIGRAYDRRSNLSDKDSSATYAIRAEVLARAINDTSGLARALYDRGRFEISVGRNLSRATPHLLESLSLYEAVHDPEGASLCYMQLGLISYILEYHEDAIRNFKLSSAHMDNATSNYLMALSYTELDSFPQARAYFSKSMATYRELNEPERVNECYMYLGRLFVKMGALDSAFHYLDLTLQNRAGSADPNALGRPSAFIAEVYLLSNDLDNAIRYASSSYEREMSRINEVRDEISLLHAANVLQRAYAAKGDFKKAFFFLDTYDKAKSAIANGSTKQKIADMRSMFDFDRRMSEQRIRQEKDKEIAEGALQKERILRNSFLAGSILLLLLVIVLFSRYRIKREANLALQEKNAIISTEKQRSDDLLLNILPYEVAEELKSKGEAEARSIEKVTVLFTDFKEFTTYAEKVTAKELVHDLHECFTAFDNIIAKYTMEKIKTIGDAYMAAGGLPIPNSSHAADVVAAALEIRDFIAGGKARKVAAGRPFFEVRLGIHTGPMVAGIVGVRKFSYDIWGDTVNIASRMESSGEVGQVNISESTYALVQDEPGLIFTPRGKVQAKGKGEMEMYVVASEH